MHLHDLGGIIWVIVVLLGVISSIRKNAQRARSNAPARAPVPRPQPRQATVHAQAFAMPPVVAPPPVTTPPVAAPPIAVAAPPIPVRVPPAVPLAASLPLVVPVRQRIGTSPIRGMFGGSATLVRAIVAAEVLGPPKSMQEQSIWSPRHSEPSI